MRARCPCCGESQRNEQAAKQKRPKKPKAGFRHGGRLVLDPSRTMPTAEVFVREHHTGLVAELHASIRLVRALIF